MKKTLLVLAVIILTVTGLQAQLQFNPASIDFGQRPLTSTTNLEVILTSQINQLISLSDLPAPFSAAPDEFVIAIGEQKTVTITFHPMTVGSFAQTLTATGSIWGTAQLLINGQAGEATINFGASSLDMGTILMTGHSQQMITVQSDIAQQITLSNLPSPFSFNPPTVDLLPNEPAQVFVSFDPLTPGYFQDVLYATGNISGSAQVVVYGSATEAFIYAIPQSVNFDPLFSGQTDTLEMIVTTDINQLVTLSGLSEVFGITPTTLVLTGGNPETVFILFNPLNPGAFNETLQLQGEVWGSLQVPVYGECIDPQISVSPAQVDFGTVALSASSTQQVTVSNTGNGTLECILANNNPHFVVSPDTMSISQGSSQDVTVIFTPDFIPAEYDTLFIESNDPDNPMVKIPLTGSGMSQVSGDVCGTWYKANSPYNFTGSVTVPETCTLTIEPGVVVNMADYDFLVNGKLVCNGLENDSIYLNGTGIFQLSSTCPNDSIDFVAIDGGSTGGDGIIIRSFSSAFKNSRIKANQIENLNKPFFWDGFEEGNWQNKWIKNGNGYIDISTQYGRSGLGLRLMPEGTWGTIEIYSQPIIIERTGKYGIHLFYMIPTYSYSTEFYWRVNGGNWNYFFGTSNYYTNWTTLDYSINYDFSTNEILEIRILSKKYSNYECKVYLDDFCVFPEIHESMCIEDSYLDVSSINNYGTNSDTIPSLKIQNSTIHLVENIETYFDKSSIEMVNSTIKKAGSDAIKTNGNNSKILLDHSTIENVSGHALTPNADSSVVIVKNSIIRNCSSYGIYANEKRNLSISVDSSLISKCSGGLMFTFSNQNYTIFSNSTVKITNSSFIENHSAIYVSGNNSPFIIENAIIQNNNYGIGYWFGNDNSTIEILNSEISENTNYGIQAYSKPASTMFLKGTTIHNNGGHGIECYGSQTESSYNVFIENSVVSSNGGFGIKSEFGQIYANYLTAVLNTEKGLVASSSVNSNVFNSIICANHNYTGLQFQGNIDFSYSKISGDPKLADSLGHLLPNSPCVDAADPTEEDAHIPFGMGTVRADMGTYGGPENWVWGGSPIPTNGEPDILQIVDLPYDQGKMVGIQYKASIFDNGHTAYDVNRYSFWRELDENGKLPLEASKTPVGQFFQKGTNYWEYVGEMPASGFANYGYSATTLGDSTVSGMFWSKFLVVAHTSDDDIYWVSQPDSGYSVDNLAPAAPMDLTGLVAGTGYTLQWIPSPDEDFQYYAIYRGLDGLLGNEPFATTTDPLFENIVLNNNAFDYAVAAFDFSGNRSELSNTLTSPVYELLEIPAGWSGISSWINPSEPSLGYLFAPASTDLIILQNMQGVYWPGQNVNTLGSWDNGSGYMIKMAQEAQIPFIGTKNPENDFQLTSGWQILSVLSNCPLTVAELQNQLGNNLVMVKEIAGWRVFWPSMGISTLETLEPGKAYFLNTLTGDGVVVFGECE